MQFFVEQSYEVLLGMNNEDIMVKGKVRLHRAACTKRWTMGHRTQWSKIIL